MRIVRSAEVWLVVDELHDNKVLGQFDSLGAAQNFVAACKQQASRGELRPSTKKVAKGFDNAVKQNQKQRSG